MIVKRGKSEITFVYTPDGDVKTVSVVGTFNGWDPEKGRMRKQKDGTFRRKETLPPGRHEYKFYVDGQWFVDPEADGRVQNTFGTENSTVLV